MKDKIKSYKQWFYSLFSEKYYVPWLIIRVFCGIFLPIKTLFRRKFLVRTSLWFIFFGRVFIDWNYYKYHKVCRV